jgi:hypothetical protein
MVNIDLALLKCTFIYSFVEDIMVAGDSKRIVVIKDISSNLIEEAILILKPGSEAPSVSGGCKPPQNRMNTRNDLILKEAEFIINQYIKEHSLVKSQNKRLPSKKPSRFHISVSSVINISLTIAVVFLLFVIWKTVC